MRLSPALAALVLAGCTPRHPPEPQIAGHELGTSTAPGPRVPLSIHVDAGNEIVASGPLSGALTQQMLSGGTAPAPAANHAAPAPAPAAPARPAPATRAAAPVPTSVASPPPRNP